MEEDGLYALSFYTKYAIQNPHDGFQIEYSTDLGVNWHQLGSRDNTDWYNYYNANLTSGPFPQGKSYFTGTNLNWKQFQIDVSFLARNPHVAFRFVFKANNEIPAQGLAIDDFRITRYEGPLKTTITEFKANYTGIQQVTIDWTTGVEYFCRRFILERSFNGFDFDVVGQLNAAGVVSSFPRSYSRTDESLRAVTYYRLKVISEDTTTGYYDEFYTPVAIVRRQTEPDQVNVILPNPFSDRIIMSFSTVVTKPVSMRLFDISGKLVREETVTPNAHYYEVDGLSLPAGVYVFSIMIGDGDIKSYKFYTAGF
jgi:hypothetical protein